MSSIESFVFDFEDILNEYINDINKEIQDGVDKVSKEVNEEVINNISFKNRTRKYVKSFRIAKEIKKSYLKVNRWYVANGEHRKAHLLEHGHALRQGGRVKAFPHIVYGAELAEKRMEEVAEEAIRNAGH